MFKQKGMETVQRDRCWAWVGHW